MNQIKWILEICNNYSPTIEQELFNNFNNFTRLCDSSIDELNKIKGLKKQTKQFIANIPEITRNYKVEKEFRQEYTTLKAVEIMRKKYINANEEQFYIISLNSAKKILNIKLISLGLINHVEIDIREIVKQLLLDKATRVVLVHNHPNHYAIESNDDIEATRKIVKIVNPLSIIVEDHIIIGHDGDYCSLKEKGYV